MSKTFDVWIKFEVTPELVEEYIGYSEDGEPYVDEDITAGSGMVEDILSAMGIQGTYLITEDDGKSTNFKEYMKRIAVKEMIKEAAQGVK